MRDIGIVICDSVGAAVGYGASNAIGGGLVGNGIGGVIGGAMMG